MGWGQLLRLNTASYFFGMKTRGEVRMSGSSSKTGCDGAAGIWMSSGGFVSDWLSANSDLDWLSGTTLSSTLVEATSSNSPIL